MITDAQLQQAMEWLGVSRDDLLSIKMDSSDELAVARLLALQTRVKKAYKKAVRELHPDRNGGCEKKTTLFRAITEVYKEIGSVELRKKDPSTTPSRSATVFRASLGGALFEICVSEVI